MKPRLSPAQGRIIRAIGLYLSNESKKTMRGYSPDIGPLVESFESQPWASLTFAGERHHLVVRQPGGTLPTGELDAGDIDVPGVIVAIERAAWHADGDDAVLTLDLVTIADESKCQAPA